uniref:Uncharacterized protein n=1 Tax=Anopheles culicifacies TaxID=139723 RepID=A0A182MDL5_9DIPT
MPPPSYIPPSANYPQAPTPPPQTQQPPGRTYGEGAYGDGTGNGPSAGVPQPSQPPSQQPAYYEYSSGSYATQPGRPFADQHANPQTGTSYRSNTPQPAAPRTPVNQGGAGSYPQRPPVYASVGSTGTRTSIHPVLDYDEEDDDDYYDEAVEVTPIVGISAQTSLGRGGHHGTTSFASSSIADGRRAYHRYRLICVTGLLRLTQKSITFGPFIII